MGVALGKLEIRVQTNVKSQIERDWGGKWCSTLALSQSSLRNHVKDVRTKKASEQGPNDSVW